MLLGLGITRPVTGKFNYIDKKKISKIISITHKLLCVETFFIILELKIYGFDIDNKI